jgi:hypothetical protein
MLHFVDDARRRRSDRKSDTGRKFDYETAVS